jgi:hypothetical protein
MKKIIISVVSLSLLFGACNDGLEEINVSDAQQDVNQLNDLSQVAISDAENNALVFMREEEKLARDVYTYLFDKWNVKVFSNISGSEQTHMNAILALMDNFQIDDPVGANQIGVFENTNLQQLHDDLIALGQADLVGAYKVGAAIEEIDILDLQKELDESIENENIRLVFENLMKGSRNHLRSFVSNLKRIGVDYAPQYMSQEAYDAIINFSSERGGR